MISIIDKRKTGKTSRLYLLAIQNNSTIVCSSPRLYQLDAQSYGLDQIKFISYQEFINQLMNRNTKDNNYLIDELEMFLNHLSPKITGYNISKFD